MDFCRSGIAVKQLNAMLRVSDKMALLSSIHFRLSDLWGIHILHCSLQPLNKKLNRLKHIYIYIYIYIYIMRDTTSCIFSVLVSIVHAKSRECKLQLLWFGFVIVYTGLHLNRLWNWTRLVCLNIANRWTKNCKNVRMALRTLFSAQNHVTYFLYTQ